jgi:hypothetical protein
MDSTHIHGAFQILFLNKLDLFTEKVQHSNIKAVFPDYDGKFVLFYETDAPTFDRREIKGYAGGTRVLPKAISETS